MDEATNKILISCVIPTCDRPQFLVEAVQSVLRQTVKPCEIIIVNNGKEIVQLPQEITSRVKIYNLPRYVGAAQARNFGAFLATGQYLAFLDDDDLWAVEYLAKVAAAAAEGARCIISRLDQLRGGKVEIFKNAHGKITLTHLLIYNPGITGSNLVIARELFFAVGGFDPKLPPSEDKSLVIEVLNLGNKVTTLPDSQAIIRFHTLSRLSDAVRLAEGVCQFTRKYGRLMTRKQYLGNWLKIYRHRYEAGQSWAFVPFVCLYVLDRKSVV